MNPVCIYDGTSIFVRDPKIFDQVFDNTEKYNVQIITDTVSGKEDFKGRFRNLTINSATNSRGPGVVIGGSLHKWKNKDHNHDVFFWEDFLTVYNEILSEFKFDPSKTDLWSLEGGLNNLLPSNFKSPIRDILENTLLLKGESKKESRTKHANKGYGLEVIKGECKHKFYDKGSQYRLEYKVLRTECSCKRRPLAKHGLITFEDLIDFEKHQSFGKHLLKAFETLLIFQPEVLHAPDLLSQDRDFLLQHNNTNAWTALQKSNYHQFKKAKNRLFTLIDKHCDINYRTEILNLMRAQLF